MHINNVGEVIRYSVVIVSYQIPRATEARQWPAKHGQLHPLNIMLNNRSRSFDIKINYWVYFGYIVTLGILALGILSCYLDKC